MKKVVSITILILVSMTSFSWSLERKPYDQEDLDEIAALYEAGEYQEALDEYFDILAEEPEDVLILGNIGNCYYKMGDYESAQQYYEEALQYDPSNYEISYNLALLSVNQNNQDYAISLLSSENILVARNDRVEGFYLLGELYYQKDMIDEAINVYLDLMSFASDQVNTDAINRNLGYLYLEKDYYATAYDYFSKVEDVYSNNYAYNFNYGLLIDLIRSTPDTQYHFLQNRGSQLLHRVDDLFRSSYFYLMALQNDPSGVEALNNLIFNYFFRNEYNKVIEIAKKGMVKHQGVVFYPMMVGFAYYKAAHLLETNPNAQIDFSNIPEVDLEGGKDMLDVLMELAITYFQTVLSIDDSYTEAYKFLGYCEMYIQQYDRGLENFNFYLEDFPMDEEIIINMVYCYTKINDYSGAIDFIKSVMDEYDIPVLSKYLGFCLNKVGYPTEALQNYEIYFSKVEDDAIAFYNAGLIYSQQGEIEAAIDAYKHSVEVNMDFYEAHFNLAILYETDGNYERAINHYLYAISIDEDQPEAYFGVASAHARQSQFIDRFELPEEETDTIPEHIQIVMDYLTMAKEKGFNNICAVWENIAFKELYDYIPFFELLKELYPGYTPGETC